MITEIIIIISLFFVSFIGLFGFPSPFVIALITLTYGYFTKFEAISLNTSIIYLVIGILALGVDNLFTLLGAKKTGASKYGMIGAFLGTLTVFFLGPIGIIVGPYLGALLGELVFAKKEAKEASKAAVGALIGVISGVVAKFVIALGLTIGFIYLIIFNNSVNEEVKEPRNNQQEVIEDKNDDNESTYKDLITVTNVNPNDKLMNPMLLLGEARGSWFFEATFPIDLVDVDGNVITQTYATADGDWMTNEFVPFSASLEYDPNLSGEGELVFKKSNPSGLPENAEEFRIKVNY